MTARINLATTLGLVAIVSLVLSLIAVAPVSGAEFAPPFQETPPAEEPEATEPAEEPEPTEPPEEPGEPPAEPEPPQEGSSNLRSLVTLGIVGLVGIAFIAIVVVLVTRPGKAPDEALAEAPLVPITTLAQDVKEGRVSKVVVSGEDLTITRIDGLILRSHKEPTSDLVQVLANLGVTPEMMNQVVIEVTRR
jgi:hypothetical protein